MAAPGLEWAVVPYNLGLLALVLATTRWVPSKGSIRVTRKHDPVLSVRASNAVVLELENDGPIDAVGRLRDEVPPSFEASGNESAVALRPGRTAEIRYHVTPKVRGSDYFRGTFLRFDAPLGLAIVERKLQTEQPVRVYPNVLALREFDLLRQTGRLNLLGIRRARTRGLGMEFNSLRDYNEDDYRRIDWKATARRGRLVVREYEQEKSQPVIVCLDAGRRMLPEVSGASKLDHALDAALLLMHAAQVAGDQVGLLTFNDAVRRYVPPRKSRSQAGVLIEAMHDLRAEPVESGYIESFGYLAGRWKRRTLIVVFTDVEDEKQAKALAGSLGPLVRRHLVFVVRVADPRMKELHELALDDDRALYRKAAALWVGADRRRADGALQAAGLNTIEAEPQDLAAALVSAYLRVKESSAL
jgi:uncharacterized protein (DUF58 family)